MRRNSTTVTRRFSVVVCVTGKVAVMRSYCCVARARFARLRLGALARVHRLDPAAAAVEHAGGEHGRARRPRCRAAAARRSSCAGPRCWRTARAAACAPRAAGRAPRRRCRRAPRAARRRAARRRRRRSGRRRARPRPAPARTARARRAARRPAACIGPPSRGSARSVVRYWARRSVSERTKAASACGTISTVRSRRAKRSLPPRRSTGAGRRGWR